MQTSGGSCIEVRAFEAWMLSYTQKPEDISGAWVILSADLDFAVQPVRRDIKVTVAQDLA